MKAIQDRVAVITVHLVLVPGACVNSYIYVCVCIHIYISTHINIYICTVPTSDIDDHSEKCLFVTYFCGNNNLWHNLVLGVKQLLVMAYHCLLVDVTAVSSMSLLPRPLLLPHGRGLHAWCHGGRRGIGIISLRKTSLI